MHSSPDHQAADLVLVHSSDLHVDDDRRIGTYAGLIGLAAVLATARRLAADAVLLAVDTFDNHRIRTSVLQRATEPIAAAEAFDNFGTFSAFYRHVEGVENV
jgi:hypothetical protein